MRKSPGQLSTQEITGRLQRAVSLGLVPHYPESFYLAEIFQNVTPRPAAVLIPLLWEQDQWHLLLTRRNATLAEHSGQVAFPGGRAEPQDTSPEDTALREAQEEVGLYPGDVHVLGRLNNFLTITNYLVTPVVGVIPWPYPLTIETSEVSRTFTIPLNWLADSANHEERQRALPHPYTSVSVVYFKPYDDEVLWGISARFTLALLHVLENGDQPVVK